MQFQIEVLKVARETKPTQKGSYQQLEVSFKNLNSGKVEAKKLMSFSKEVANAYKTLNDAKAGDTYLITAEKNEKTGYWDWVNAQQDAPGSEPQVTPGTSAAKPASAAPRSTYETPEERAKKQVYIVRQSSISSALEFHKGTAFTLDEVLETAEQFTNFVFNGREESKSGPSLVDMPNDIDIE